MFVGCLLSLGILRLIQTEIVSVLGNNSPEDQPPQGSTLRKYWSKENFERKGLSICSSGSLQESKKCPELLGLGSEWTQYWSWMEWWGGHHSRTTSPDSLTRHLTVESQSRKSCPCGESLLGVPRPGLGVDSKQECTCAEVPLQQGVSFLSEDLHKQPILYLALISHL